MAKAGNQKFELIFFDKLKEQRPSKQHKQAAQTGSVLIAPFLHLYVQNLFDQGILTQLEVNMLFNIIIELLQTCSAPSPEALEKIKNELLALQKQIDNLPASRDEDGELYHDEIKDESDETKNGICRSYDAAVILMEQEEALWRSNNGLPVIPGVNYQKFHKRFICRPKDDPDCNILLFNKATKLELQEYAPVSMINARIYFFIILRIFRYQYEIDCNERYGRVKSGEILYSKSKSNT